jgi:hypothetical protein
VVRILPGASGRPDLSGWSTAGGGRPTLGLPRHPAGVSRSSRGRGTPRCRDGVTRRIQAGREAPGRSEPAAERRTEGVAGRTHTATRSVAVAAGVAAVALAVARTGTASGSVAVRRQRGSGAAPRESQSSLRRDGAVGDDTTASDGRLRSVWQPKRHAREGLTFPPDEWPPWPPWPWPGPRPDPFGGDPIPFPASR